MTDILDVICTSVSVPRPHPVSGAALLAALRDPDQDDADKATIAEAVLTEVAPGRLAELVRSGRLRWAEVARAAARYGLDNTETSRLAHEMASWEEPGLVTRTVP